MDLNLSNNLIALVHEKDLPFDIEIGEAVEGSSINVAIAYEAEDELLLSETMNEVINAML